MRLERAKALHRKVVEDFDRGLAKGRAPTEVLEGLNTLVLTELAQEGTSEQTNALLDDTAWGIWKERLCRGEFKAAALELPVRTYAPDTRTRERPAGRKGLPPELKEKAREETLLSRRVADAAQIMHRLNRPWAVVVRLAPDSVASPFDGAEWAALKGDAKRAQHDDAFVWGEENGLAGWVSHATPTGAEQLTAARAWQPSARMVLSPSEPARLVRSAPHKLTAPSTSSKEGQQSRTWHGLLRTTRRGLSRRRR